MDVPYLLWWSEQYFGGAVPPRSNVVGEAGVAVFRCQTLQGASQPEVAYLDEAFFVQQNVTRLKQTKHEIYFIKSSQKFQLANFPKRQKFQPAKVPTG